MSDERRQTRLLPFRIGRRAAGRGATAGRAVDAPADAELRELLRAWEAPAPSRAVRVRLLAAFRVEARPVPLWRRLLSAQVKVPLPLAACAVVALLALASALAYWPVPHISSEAPVLIKDAPTLRVVEVPGPERVVERVVYVETKDARSSRREVQPPAARTRVRDRATVQGREETANYFTRVNMAEFEPAGEMTLRVIKKGEER